MFFVENRILRSPHGHHQKQLYIWKNNRIRHLSTHVKMYCHTVCCQTLRSSKYFNKIIFENYVIWIFSKKVGVVVVVAMAMVTARVFFLRKVDFLTKIVAVRPNEFSTSAIFLKIPRRIQP